MVNILFKKVAKKSKLYRRQSTGISSHLANLWEGIIAFFIFPSNSSKEFSESFSSRHWSPPHCSSPTLRHPPNRNRTSLLKLFDCRHKLVRSFGNKKVTSLKSENNSLDQLSNIAVVRCTSDASA